MATDRYCGKCDRYYSVENHQCLTADVIARAVKAEAEVERLKALCAERPPDSGEHNFEAFHKWLDKIDAAGRGEDNQ